MAQAERYAWFSLIAWIGILFFLWMRFTTGMEILGQSFGLTIVEQSAGRLLGTYVTLAIIAIIAESVIASVTATQAVGSGVQKDERDHAIEARSNLAAYWFVAATLNVIVIHILASAAYDTPLAVNLNLASTTGIAFAILLVLVGAEIVKRIALIWNYRAA